MNFLRLGTDFEWAQAPFSSVAFPIAAVVGYLLLTFVLTKYMRTRPAFNVSANVVALHNMVLSIGSLVMFVGSVVEFYLYYVGEGSLHWFFCWPNGDNKSASGPLYFWSYVYYLSKYYEFIDTFLVVLRKSNVPHFGLQVYHHAVVVIMAWLWLETKQTLQHGGLLMNTFVHVVMYHYYAAKVLGKSTPWKRWITRIQIIQFVLSFLWLAVTVYRVLGPERAQCKGLDQASSYSLVFNAVFNATLLKSFVGVDKKNARDQSKTLPDSTSTTSIKKQQQSQKSKKSD